jgi:hypothetical protein
MIDPKAVLELKIYPPIGIARVGNAGGANDYVIGPELIGGPPTLPGAMPEQPARYVGDFRTADGKIKRQAARFRVYAHMKDGSVEEVTAASGKIEWRVAVANLKAGWYEFNQAMDLDIAQPALQRNRDLVTSSNRLQLDIVPTPKSISGQGAGPVTLDDGKFCDIPVTVGELRTDQDGRLIFLGGRGRAGTRARGIGAFTFANNPGWYDDLCDGPVRAKVTFSGGEEMDAEPAYVSVTPPNYAPGVFGVVTMDDTVREVFYGQKWLPRPDTTFFLDDVLPIFKRLSELQWVNHGLFILHGFGSPLDANDPKVVAQLADGSAANASWRQAVFNLFRDPEAGGNVVVRRIPQAFGDGVDTFDSRTDSGAASSLLSVTKAMYDHLKRWADGKFDPGHSPSAPAAADSFSTLKPADQVVHLERASLHDCLGGPFHPAMELTWVMRIALLWKEAYRLKILPGERAARQDFGDVLQPVVCTGRGGPYDGAAAGCLTRFLGVPWHTDHTSCNSAADYDPGSFLSMPTFWGPRAPDQVLGDGNYLRAAALSSLKDDPTLKGDPTQQAFKHLMHRVDWLRDIRGSGYNDRLALMIREWAELGMVLPVKDASTKLPVEGLRVEQGRNHQGELMKVETGSKYALTSDVEALFEPPKPSPQGLPAPAGIQSKRTYRQGQI